MLPDKVLHLLEDGEWHPVREVACRFQITIQQAESMIELLEDGGFIQFDRPHSRAIINVPIQRILREIEDDEASSGKFITT